MIIHENLISQINELQTRMHSLQGQLNQYQHQQPGQWGPRGPPPPPHPGGPRPMMGGPMPPNQMDPSMVRKIEADKTRSGTFLRRAGVIFEAD